MVFGGPLDRAWKTNVPFARLRRKMEPLPSSRLKRLSGRQFGRNPAS
jgi:hypothetical protein